MLLSLTELVSELLSPGPTLGGGVSNQLLVSSLALFIGIHVWGSYPIEQIKVCSTPFIQQMGRTPCCEKVGLKRGRWTEEEDEILTKYIQANGEGSWRSLPKNAGT